MNIDNVEYEMIPPEAVVLSNHLFTLKDKLGIPDDISHADLNDVSWRFVLEIFGTWRAAYPHEYRDWIEGLLNELKYERPVKKAVQGGGFTPIAYPLRVYELMKVFLPNVHLGDKGFIKKLLTHIPELKTTNYKL